MEHTALAGWENVWAMRRQDHDQPVAEDWVWHVVLPVVAYAAVLLAAIDLASRPGVALFAVGGATLLLMCIGIHNAWGPVTPVARGGPGQRNADQDEAPRL